MRKKFLLDVDGILADFCGAAAALMSRVGRREIHARQIDRWDVTTMLDDEEHRAVSKAHMEAPGFCSSIEPYAGAVEAVAELSSMADVHYVTAPMHKNRFWVSERVEWLERHFGADPKDVVFAYRKHLVAGDLILEDTPSNAGDWHAAHGGAALLWDRPYNLAEEARGGVVRVSSWDDVLRHAHGSLVAGRFRPGPAGAS